MSNSDESGGWNEDPPSKDPPSKDFLQEPVDQFTSDLLRKKWESSDEDNILVSPIGIMITYIMLLERIHGKTADQIISVLHLRQTFENVERIRNEFIKVMRLLNQVDEKLITLKIANKVIINQERSIKSSYEKILKENYSTSIDRENFSMGTELMERLNAWATLKTNNLIAHLFDEPLDSDKILVLINLLYFKGLWLVPFSEFHTRDGVFNNYDGTRSIVKMMDSSRPAFAFSYRRDENLKIIRLPYEGEVTMFIFMPTIVGGLQELIKTLTAEKIKTYLEDLRWTELYDVKIPKFRFEHTHELRSILTSMGLDLPFKSSADFDAISDRPIHISEFIQKTAIVLDEKGTEAALRNCFGYRFVLGKPDEFFILDRPFLFLLRNNDPWVNLFAGIVRKLPDIYSQQ